VRLGVSAVLEKPKRTQIMLPKKKELRVRTRIFAADVTPRTAMFAKCSQELIPRRFGTRNQGTTQKKKKARRGGNNMATRATITKSKTNSKVYQGAG